MFKISPAGGLKTLYSFCAQAGCPDGEFPNGLVQAGNGELYGTTQNGGVNPGPLNTGGGTIFEISPAGKLTARLYSFCAQSSCQDGAYPNAGLVLTANGDLYGTTFQGGANTFGTVFKFTPGGTIGDGVQLLLCRCLLRWPIPHWRAGPGANGGPVWDDLGREAGITVTYIRLDMVFKIILGLRVHYAPRILCDTVYCRTAHILLAPAAGNRQRRPIRYVPWAAVGPDCTDCFPEFCRCGTRSSTVARIGAFMMFYSFFCYQVKGARWNVVKRAV